MSTYNELLKDPLWKAKREEILERDNHKCCYCGSTKNLQVHHKYYKDFDTLPWEYENDALITLCKDCHFKEHIKKDFINTFSYLRELGKLGDYYNKFNDIIYITAIKYICQTFKPKKELDSIKIRLHLYENWEQDKNSKKIVNGIKKKIYKQYKLDLNNEDVDNLLHYLRDKLYTIKYIDYDSKEADFIMPPGQYWFICNHKFKYDKNGDLKEEII